MSKRRAVAVVEYPGTQKVVASIATTENMIVLALSDGREEHYTYPVDGRFHVTTHETPSIRSFFAPGPPLAEAGWHRIALVVVPEDQSELVREYRPSSDRSMALPPPAGHDGILEIGVLGSKATPEIVAALQGPGLLVETFQGPRSGTTIALRYHPLSGPAT